MDVNETSKILAKTIVKGIIAKHSLKMTDEAREKITPEQKENLRELVQKLEMDVKDVLKESHIDEK